MNGNDRKESKSKTLTCRFEDAGNELLTPQRTVTKRLFRPAAPVMKLVTHVCPAPSSHAVRVPVSGPTHLSFAGPLGEAAPCL